MALTEATIITRRTNSLQPERSFKFTVGTGAIIFPGACVAIELATGSIIVPIATSLVRIGGFVDNGPADGDETFVATETAMVVRGGERLLAILDVATTTNPGVPVYATSDNVFLITKPTNAIGIIGHITEVTQEDEAWVLIDLAEVNP